MQTMNKAQLEALIKDVTLPLIKDVAGPAVAEIVEAQVAKATSAQTQTPPWIEKFMDGLSKKDQAETPTRAKGAGFGRIVRAAALAKRDGGGFDGVVKQLTAWGDKDLAEGMVQAKALSASNAAAGGYLVPIQQANEIIELRRAATVIRSAGVPELPLPTGTLQVPKIASGATGSYIGENSNITKSEQTFGNVQLTAKKLAVLTPISNDLIRNSSPQADTVVRNDIVRSLSVTEDVAFLRADGTNGQPQGLRNLAPAANISNSTGTALTNMTADLGTLMLALMNNNTMPGRWTWIFSPRTWKALTTVLTTNGTYAFREEMVQRQTLWGFPFKVTTSVPITLTVGANSDCSEIYLFNADDQIIGDNLNLSIDVSSEAAYFDGSSVVAAFSRDQTVIRAIAEHDFNTRYPESIAVLLGVRWS